MLLRRSVTASVMPLKFLALSFPWMRRLSCFPAIVLLSCASSALSQAPAIVVDAQQTIGSSYSNPASIAVSGNGTVYVADTGNNQVVALVTNLPGGSTQTP